jgi:hypothetical protein
MNVIPNFDHNHVIPPHLGDPTLSNHLSPYNCSTLQLCQRFATSLERIEILKGLLNFRERMRQEGITSGFQWLDGSFIENIEVKENRAPRDLDLVTFFGGLTLEQQNVWRETFPEFINSQLAKEVFKLDHYFVDYCFRPDVTVEYSRYWIQLFTHNRAGVWKGILRLELNTPEIDNEAFNFLNQVKL